MGVAVGIQSEETFAVVPGEISAGRGAGNPRGAAGAVPFRGYRDDRCEESDQPGIHPHAIKVMTWGGLRGGISVALALSLR